MQAGSNPVVVEQVDELAGWTTVMAELTTKCLADSRKRSKHFRAEQLSQGVLARLLKSIGRITFEEVHMFWNTILSLSVIVLHVLDSHFDPHQVA